jgi:hypothetical protein
MPVKITNVSLDPAYALKRRQASKLQMEPVIAGDRLRMRQSRVLTDEQVAANKEWLAELERAGVVKMESDQAAAPPSPPAPAPEPPKMEKPMKMGEEEKDPDRITTAPLPKMSGLPPLDADLPPPPPAPASDATEPPPPSGGHSRRDDRKRGR